MFPHSWVLRHGYEFFNVSKRLENVPPVGWDRGRSSIHILRSIFGMDWEETVQVPAHVNILNSQPISCLFRSFTLATQLLTRVPWRC